MGRAERARSVVEAPAPEAPKLNEAEIEKIHTETARMDVRERIAYWDKRQAVEETALACPNDAAHGRLTITGSAALMICGARKGGAWCTGSMPVSV